MKLYTLGTSHGATEVGRACSSNLITVGDALYLFDCGGNTEGKMTDMNLPIDKIRAVFITHMHEDHVGTLSAIVKRFVHYHREATPVQLYLPEEAGISAFQQWLSALHISIGERASFHLVECGKIYQDENITVTAISTEHLGHIGFPSFAYMIETKDKKMLYTGDLSGDFHDYPQILFEEEFDAVLCELVHFKVANNLDTIIKTKTKQLIFTHLAPRNIPVIHAAEEKFPFSVKIAEDCASFEI